jgi:amino acid transporter
MAEHLRRRIGFGLLTAYGVGVMVGAGIYVLVGAVAAEAGIWAPISFLIAGVIAAPTALSYAEFSARVPEAAGEAAFVRKGLQSRFLSVLVGLAIVMAGTISAAAVLRGGTGYLMLVMDLHAGWTMVVLGALLTAVAVFGVMESLALAAVFTVVELCGLALVIWAGWEAPVSQDWATPPPFALAGVGAAAVLAFFAFIGFEDIVNMAEEVSDPVRTMPKAILVALVLTTVIYTLVAVAAVRAVPLDTLGASERPLALVWQAAQGGDAKFLSTIAVFAALNGVLAQIVMASRVLFGLGKREQGFAFFHHVWRRTGTPVLATCLVGTFVILGALALNVGLLAEMTSSILLGVFVLVNLALLLEKRRMPEAAFRVPMFVPVIGLVLAGGALIFNLQGAL